MRRMSIDCTDREEPSPGNDIGRLYSGTLQTIKSRLAATRAANPAPDYVRIVGKPELITGPDTLSHNLRQVLVSPFLGNWPSTNSSAETDRQECCKTAARLR